jgi:hypothetical protein
MAEAKVFKGRALVAYVGDVGVDSEGVPIEGAPKRPPLTPSEQQPGAMGAPSPEERMAIAIAQAITNPKELAARAPKAAPKPAAREEAEEDEEEVVVIDRAPSPDSLAAAQESTAGAQGHPAGASNPHGESVAEKAAGKRGGRRAAKKS